jgi:hypothetical protein
MSGTTPSVSHTLSQHTVETSALLWPTLSHKYLTNNTTICTWIIPLLWNKKKTPILGTLQNGQTCNSQCKLQLCDHQWTIKYLLHTCWNSWFHLFLRQQGNCSQHAILPSVLSFICSSLKINTSIYLFTKDIQGWTSIDRQYSQLLNGSNILGF